MDAGKLLWEPPDELLRDAAMARFMRARGFGDYGALWRWSVEELPAFWAAIWEELGDLGPHGEVLADASMPGAVWFPGTELNYAERLFRGKPDEREAILHASESRPLSTWTWGELREHTARIRAGLAARGVGRGARPDRAERRGRQERRRRLRDVRQVRRHAIPAADAARHESRPDLRGLLAQIPPRPARQRPRLGRVQDRLAVVRLAAEQPLRVVELGAREPHGAGHRRVGEHLAVRPQLAQVLPDRGPERRQVLHGPAPQRPVVAEAVGVHEARHRRIAQQVVGRLPEQLPRSHQAGGIALRFAATGRRRPA